MRKSDAPSAGPMVVLGLMIIVGAITGMVWLSQHFSQQQRCERSTMAERGLKTEQAVRWCERNAQWS